MKFPLLIVMLAGAWLLQGCYTPLVEGVQQGWDVARRDALRAEAAPGDAQAQYDLGNTWCCQGGGPMDSVTVYDNQQATTWFCKAARQGYGPAQMRLAQLYSGDAIHGLHIVLRASALIGAERTDFGVALMWAQVAARRGADGAAALQDDLAGKSNAKQHARAAALIKSWRGAPCTWSEVFPAG